MPRLNLSQVPDAAKYLSAIFFLSYLGRNMVWKFLPLFFEAHIPDVFLVGVLMALPAAIPVILDIPTGNVVQRAGERIVIFLGLILLALPGLFYLAAAPVLLAAGKVTEGLSKTLVWNGSWSFALRSPDEDVESESISIFLLGVNIAAIVGPIIGGYLIVAYGYAVPLTLWVIAAALAVPFFYAYVGTKRDMPLHDALRAATRRSTYQDDWRHITAHWRRIRLPLALAFLYSILLSFFWLAVPLLLDAVGADITMMGLLFGIAALPRAFTYFFGVVADQYGNARTTMVLSAGMLPLLVGMGLATDPMIVGGLFLAASLLRAGLKPCLHALFDERVPDEIEAELTGVLELCKHTGQVIGPLAGGAIAATWSLNTAFIAAGGIAAALFALAANSTRHR